MVWLTTASVQNHSWLIRGSVLIVYLFCECGPCGFKAQKKQVCLPPRLPVLLAHKNTLHDTSVMLRRTSVVDQFSKKTGIARMLQYDGLAQGLMQWP